METVININYVIAAGFIVYFIMRYAYKLIIVGNSEVELETGRRFPLLNSKHSSRTLILTLNFILVLLLVSFTNDHTRLDKPEDIRYSIVKNDKVLGYINLKKRIQNERTTYTINSIVNTKFIIDFKATSNENYVYEKGNLIYSSIYRKVNNRIKVDQSFSYRDGQYYLKGKNGISLLNTDVIKCNLILLFFDEPLNVNEVYCDKLNLYLKVEKIGSCRYKVFFPNKTYNIFYYEKGKCSKIEVKGPFYKVNLLPVKRNNWQSEFLSV
ncbi:MAG: hypothetical protein HKO81_06515 [Flavobacteriaceae bacterium]|nr:hypothetical protein [Flavobacteriaceae bacterium]